MTDENSNGESKNPYVGRGLILSEIEYELCTQALTVLGELSEKQGEPRIKVRCHQLMHQMTGVVHAGEGLSPEQAQRYGQRILNAMQAAATGRVGAEEELIQAVGMLIAASVRIEADPADKIGLMLSQFVRSAAEQGSRVIAVAFMREMAAILGDAETEWKAADWPVTPAEVHEWIASVLATGIENIEAGREPWAQDDEPVANELAAAQETVNADTPQ